MGFCRHAKYNFLACGARHVYLFCLFTLSHTLIHHNGWYETSWQSVSNTAAYRRGNSNRTGPKRFPLPNSLSLVPFTTVSSCSRSSRWLYAARGCCRTTVPPALLIVPSYTTCSACPPVPTPLSKLPVSKVSKWFSASLHRHHHRVPSPHPYVPQHSSHPHYFPQSLTPRWPTAFPDSRFPTSCHIVTASFICSTLVHNS